MSLLGYQLNRAMKLAIAFMMLVGIVPLAYGAPTSRPSDQGPALTDLQNVVRHPLDVQAGHVSVIIWIGVDCPISNAYAPEINRLCKHYEGKATFYLIHDDTDITVDVAKKHTNDFDFTCPVLIDKHHIFSKLLDAGVTPECAVIAPGGKMVYRGRISDLYYGLGQRRFKATTHELADAMDDVLAGRDVKVTRTKVVGCTIDQS